uniref:Major facilitator superfamily (MFS) profile domain-containing protein n=1 Tax=Glossina austeni TaxID=7395 RepID=A0A1A9V156_GLOAU
MQFSGKNREGIDIGRSEEDGHLGHRQTAKVLANEWEYEQVLEEIGFGKTQWLLLLISGLITTTSMAAQTSLGIIAIASQCEFNMTQGEKGVMMASSVAGIVVSTYIWGYISDVVGRRSLLVWCTFITSALLLITMFVTNIWLFNFINLIMGISLGGISGTLYPYLGEFNTFKYRAVVINYCNMFVSVAAIYMPATAWLVLSFDWSLPITSSFSFRPWRLILLFNLLPGFLGILMMLPFPESPKFLLAQQKHEQAVAAINWISKFNRNIDVNSLLKITELRMKTEELSESLQLITGRNICSILKNVWKATVPLFQKPYGGNFSLAVVALFGLFFASNGMQIWYPEIVNRSAHGSETGQSATVCTILDESFERDHLRIVNNTDYAEDIPTCNDSINAKTYVDNIIMGLAFLVGFSIQGAILNPLGRKNVLLSALGLGVLSGLLLHFVTNTTGILILFCLYILLPGLSISTMCGALVDLVPTQLRGKAVSMGMTLGRLGLILASNLIAVMLEPYCNGIFAIVTCTVLVCGLLVHFLPI